MGASRSLGLFTTLLLGECLLTGKLVRAADIQQTVYMLPDEAAECRYIDSLVKEAESAVDSAKKLQREGESLSGRAAIPKLLAAAEFSLKFANNKALDIYSAGKAVEIKRGTVPACVTVARNKAGDMMQETLLIANQCTTRVNQITGMR